MKTDIWDNDDKYVVSVELPGLEKTDIGINFKNDTLTVSTVKQDIADEDHKAVMIDYKKKWLTALIGRDKLIGVIKMDQKLKKFYYFLANILLQLCWQYWVEQSY